MPAYDEAEQNRQTAEKLQRIKFATDAYVRKLDQMAAWTRYCGPGTVACPFDFGTPLRLRTTPPSLRSGTPPRRGVASRHNCTRSFSPACFDVARDLSEARH